MDQLGWAAVVQTVIVAIGTWYIRRGSHQDAVRVVTSTAAQTTSNEILKRVAALEEDMALVKSFVLKTTGVDHRGPAREQKGS